MHCLLLCAFLFVPQSASGKLFPSQEEHAHGSGVVELEDTSLIAVWYQGSGERRANDVRLLGSRLPDSESGWSAPFPMADTPGLPDCNPTLFVDAEGRLYLFWVVIAANRWEQAVLKYRRADEPLGAGEPDWSWQDTIHLVPGEAFARGVEEGFRELAVTEHLWAAYAPRYSSQLIEAARDPVKRQCGWMTRVHPVLRSDGRILLPLYSDGFNLGLMALGEADGESWRALGPIVSPGGVQPSPVPLGEGRWIAFLRDNGPAPHRMLRSSSTDDGLTWSVAIDTPVPNSGSSVEAISLPDGRIALALNDLERGRYRLSLFLSSDEGKTWPDRRVVAHDPRERHSYSYPSLILASDGRLHLTYSHSGPEGETIAHAVLEP
ncbi:MAG: neuraminidase [Planctomycetes bacterium]|jgi:predicted neuraminidase|nr:neuraminidase [Planctomycetota bacterium]MDP6407899.1 exo-alpha-sialidase [Planctomycetota bacterium]